MIRPPIRWVGDRVEAVYLGMTLLALLLINISGDSPAVRSESLVENGKHASTVKSMLARRSISADDLATTAWCLVWQQRLNRVRLGSHPSSKEVKKTMALFDSATGAKDCHFYLARFTFESTFWTEFVVPGSDEFPIKRVQETRILPNGTEKKVWVLSQDVTAPSALTQARLEECLRKAIALGPEDPQVLLMQSSRSLDQGHRDKARAFLQLATEKGVGSQLPLETLVLGYDLDPSPRTREALREYIGDTGDSPITKCLLAGRKDLAMLMRRTERR